MRKRKESHQTNKIQGTDMLNFSEVDLWEDVDPKMHNDTASRLYMQMVSAYAEPLGQP